MPYTNLVGDSSFQDHLACIQTYLWEKRGRQGKLSALLKFVWGSMVELGIVLIFSDSQVSA